MDSVLQDVVGPLNAVGEIAKGLAAKNQTMKDGPPEGGAGEATTQPRPTPEQEQGAYDDYKKKVSEAWRRHTDANGNVDRVGLGLDVGQAVADLAMKAGPGVLKLFGELAGAGK